MCEDDVVKSLTFMIGIGSSPGAPRSSIMFLMSMERSATLRSAKERVSDDAQWWEGAEREWAHTSDDLDIVAGDQLDGLLTLGRRHVVWK